MGWGGGGGGEGVILTSGVFCCPKHIASVHHSESEAQRKTRPPTDGWWYRGSHDVVMDGLGCSGGRVSDD